MIDYDDDYLVPAYGLLGINIWRTKKHIPNILTRRKPATPLTETDPKAYNIFTIFWYTENLLSPLSYMNSKGKELYV